MHRRLPGETLAARGETRLEELLALVELEADAPGADGPGYGEHVAHVLFDGWDDVWVRAEAVAPAACARLRSWLRPAHGHRWPSSEFAHQDLNLTNVLADESGVTGVVDEATLRCAVAHSAIGRLGAPGAQRDPAVAAGWADVAESVLRDLA